MVYIISRLQIIIFLKMFYRFKVIGRENVPRGEAVMIVCNHASFLDPAILGAAVKRILIFFARSDLFKIPLLGQWMWAVGSKPISLGKFELSLLHKISKIVKEKKAFAIFPEGTRSFTGEIMRGKPGVGLIAWKTKVKVLPALIEGSFKALPRQAKFIHPAKIKVTLGKVLDLNDFYGQEPSKELYQQISDRMMASIKAAGMNSMETGCRLATKSSVRSTSSLE